MTRRTARLALDTLEDRLTPAVAGTLDPTFGVGGRQMYPVAAGSAGLIESSLIAKSDGKLVLVGTDGTDGFMAVGVNRDGTSDATFGQGGATAFHFGGGSDFANAATAQPDGKILLVGSTFGGADSLGNVVINFAVARLTTTGALDSTFGAGGKITYGNGIVPTQAVARAVAVLPDGKIVVAGTEYDPTVQVSGVLVVRFLASGLVDTGFGVGGAVRLRVGVSDDAAGVVVLPDGRIVVGGTVGPTANAGGDLFAVRFMADGATDPTFGANGRTVIDLGQVEATRAIALQRDGKVVLVGGTGAGPDGQSGLTGVAVRLDADGNFDPSFGSNGRVLINLGPQNTASGVAVQPNGKLVLSGGPTSAVPVGTDRSLRAVRLNADGTLDQSFGTGGGATVGFDGDTSARAVAVQPDGGIVIAGTSGGAFAVTRLTGDAVPVPAGSVFVGGSPDGSARLLAPFPVSLQPYPALAFYPNFSGSVRTAMADVNGDGVADYVTGPGPGGGPNVVVTDGKTGAVLANLDVFETTFTGGVFVAAADLNGDGKAEVVVTPDQGGGPVVVIYDGAGLTAGKNNTAQLVRFFGIDDSTFRGGARPALGDVNGDGAADLVVAAGFGGGPRVAVFDGPRTADRSRWEYAGMTGPRGVGSLFVPPKLVGDFFVFEPTLRNGVFVAAGDLNRDGKAEVVFGGGPGGGPRVLALDGAALTAGQQKTVANFFDGDANGRGGVRVVVRTAPDGSAQLVTGSGEGQAGRVNVYKAATAVAGGAADQVVKPFGDGLLADGVFVG